MKKIIVLMSITISMYSPLFFAMKSSASPEAKVVWWHRMCEEGQWRGINPLSLFFRQNEWSNEHSVIPASEHLSKRNIVRIIRRDVKHALSYDDTQVNDQDDYSLKAPLHWACTGWLPCHKQLLNILLSEPTININIQDVHGRTPLYYAFLETSQECFIDKRIDMLLATGKIDFSSRDMDGKNILRYVDDKYREACEVYEDREIECNEKGMEDLLKIYEVGMHKIIKAAATPIQCVLIKAVLHNECAQEDNRVVLCSDVQGLIMYFFYAINIERVVACKYKPWRHRKGTHDYYDKCFCEKKEIKESIMKSPTQEHVQLLWG